MACTILLLALLNGRKRTRPGFRRLMSSARAVPSLQAVDRLVRLRSGRNACSQERILLDEVEDVRFFSSGLVLTGGNRFINRWSRPRTSFELQSAISNGSVNRWNHRSII